MARWQRTRKEGHIRGGPPQTELTQHEETILGLLASGLSNQAIGEQLHMSPHTVKNLLGRAIYPKLGFTPLGRVSKRVRAAVWYLNQEEGGSHVEA